LFFAKKKVSQILRKTDKNKGNGTSFMQTPRSLEKIEYLVFGVGAIRGIAFIDAYDELLSSFPALIPGKDLRGLAGASAGALMCLAVALRLSRTEMLAFFQHDWFVNTPWFIKNSCGRLSLISMEPLREALRAMFMNKGFDPDITFEQFLPLLDLRVTAFNLNTLSSAVFSREKTPDVSVVEAVLASASMPAILPPVSIKSECYVDGVIADDFPVKEFPAASTLGFYLCDFLRCTTSRLKELSNSYDVVVISVSRLFPLEFNPSPELRSWTLEQGRSATKKYLGSGEK
jgi:predicted acylesterase/phospholipase RssA